MLPTKMILPMRGGSEGLGTDIGRGGGGGRYGLVGFDGEDAGNVFVGVWRWCGAGGGGGGECGVEVF